MTDGKVEKSAQYLLRPPSGAPPADSSGITLKPPGASESVAVGANHHIGIWLLFAGLLMLAFSVVFVLPKLGSPPVTASVEAAAPPLAKQAVTLPSDTLPSDRLPNVPQVIEQTPLKPLVPDSKQTARHAADVVLKNYLPARARLESANAQTWAAADWQAALDVSAQADQHYAEGAYSMAAERYARATAAMEALEGSKSERFKAALAAALQAAKQTHWQEAVTQLEKALAVYPENEQAQALLARARLRPELTKLMKQAAGLEEKGNLAAASEAYNKARQLDPDYSAAQQAFERVTAQVTDQRFLVAMQNALSALESRQLAEADKALRQAEALKPADSALVDAQVRLSATRHGIRAGALKQQAAQKADAEDWPAAVDLYGKLLVLQPNSASVRDALERAEARGHLHRQLDQMLSQQERLYSQGPLNNAERLLSSVDGSLQDEPKLFGKIRRLEQQVDAAKTPRTLSLRSDGLTQVTIYRVGRLGRFQMRDIQLLPGLYTVVGQRDGYRDVRQSIRVEPGRDPQPVTVQCRELI